MSLPQAEIQELLKQLARSFYLTLRILPSSIRGPIGLAYLLARATDTVADTPLIRLVRRHEALLQLRESIRDACDGREGSLAELGDIAEAQDTMAGEGTPAEGILLKHFGDLLAALRTLAPDDRVRIGELLETITRGQETDLLLFTRPDRISAFNSDQELDRYTYEVAGCVGEFWTRMCRAHLFPAAPLDDTRLRADAIRFGKGLQLVNILRDLPKDLRLGRCYIPLDQLATRGLNPVDLLDPGTMDRFRPIYEAFLQQAENHLSAGWQYTLALPFRCVRVRFACAWPILIGARTLRELRLGNVLDNTCRIKVSRSEIRQLVLRSIILYIHPVAWNRLFESSRNRSSTDSSQSNR